MAVTSPHYKRIGHTKELVMVHKDYCICLVKSLGICCYTNTSWCISNLLKR